MSENTKQNRNQVPTESPIRALRNRIFQMLARFGPGGDSLRTRLHRWRGVKIGEEVHINYDVILETAYPQWISIGSRVQIGIRSTIIGHIHALPPTATNLNDGDYASVRIEDDVNIGPGVIILPNVTIGEGAVVMAGSVVTKTVPPYSMVQGNPAKVIAKCGIPLGWETPLKEFYKKLRPVTTE